MEVQSCPSELMQRDSSSPYIGEEVGGGSVPSNVYEYFHAVEAGRFPFFNNTQVHVSAMRNASGETLLITAARLGHVEIVERLVADIDIEVFFC